MNSITEKFTIKRCEQTCLACPSQWDLYTADGKYIYARYRWGHLTVHLNAFTKIEKMLFEWFGDNDLDGIMSTDELQELTKDILDWNQAIYE